MDRSTRNLSIITLVVLSVFLALDHISRRAALADWWLVLLFLLLAVGIWFYDRVSRRGIDDSEMPDTPIEPLIYEHHAGSIGIPESIQVAGPGVNVVTTPYQEALPVIEAPATKTEPVESQAAANLTSTPSTDVIERDKSEAAPPAPPATATVTTPIEEKAAPPTSAAAPETHPEIASQSPGGIHAPSVPVSKENSDEPVPSSISGSAPEPTALPTPPLEVPQETIKVKSNPTEASAAPAVPSAPAAVSQEPVKSQSAAPEVEVSASAAAAAALNVGDPNLPMHAVTDQPDDLKIIEGIGPKMEKALNAAGISTFAVLAGTSEEQINAAITAAGMRFAPTVPTWAEQASYAANGDFVGLEAFQRTLKGGRKVK